MAFNFGSTSTANKPLFGATATTTSAGSSLFGGFGTSAPASSAGFSFGTSSGSTLGGGLGTGLTTAAGGFGTGLSTGTSGFGTGTTGFGTSSSGFGTGTSTFGTGTSGFGTGLGTGLGTSTSTGFGTGFGLGSTQQQQQQQQQASQEQVAALQLSNMATAVSLPVIFGDERDAILAKWNQLQAFWGTGKGYCSQQGPPVVFGLDNPFCRFKAVGFSCIPTKRNKDGLVAVIFDKKEEEIRAKQQEIVDALHKVFGSKPQYSVCVNAVRPLPDNKTEMVFYLQERAQTGVIKRLLASDVFNYMSQANIQQQLKTNLSVHSVLPKTGLSADQLKRYLDNPPAGIDPLIWSQAKADNPDPDKLLPVPMIGFSELHRRLKHQEQQTQLHNSRLEIISDSIETLQRNHSDMTAKIEQYKRKHLELSHRVLQVLVRQEVYRKQGYAVQVEEEQLRVHMEAIQAELNAPTQFKGRLNEMMSQLRMQCQLGIIRPEATYQMDAMVQTEVRQHLKQQQEGLTHLISIIKGDLEDLQLIEQGLTESATMYRR